MRFEQFITAVTRPVVVATVREFKAVMSFATAMCLHLWLQRKSLGMPEYTGLLLMSPAGDLGRCYAAFAGSQRGQIAASTHWVSRKLSVGNNQRLIRRSIVSMVVVVARAGIA